MITVTKVFEFEAAHHLPNYDGKCSKIHGHSYKLEVEVGRKNKSTYPTMILDFSVLKKIVKEKIIDRLDHSYLNDIFEYPTAEAMVNWIRTELAHTELFVERIRLWETSTSYAEWRR